MHTAARNHIMIDEKGVACVASNRIKVIRLAAEKRYHGAAPELMKEYWPDLSLAEIYSALAYYYDHQDEMDAEMDRNEEEVEARRAENPNPFTRAELEQRLRERGQ